MRYISGFIIFVVLWCQVLWCQNGYAQIPFEKTTVEYVLDLNARLKKGEAEAQFEKGMNILLYQEATQTNRQNGISWVNKAAQQNYVEAQYELGKIYSNGKYAVKDPALAVKWTVMAAKSGYDLAQNKLGFLYFYGNSAIKRDDVQSTYWYQKSALQGNVTAQVVMGQCYEEGMGIPQNTQKAIYWYKIAAAQGNSLAKTQLTKLETRMLKQQKVTAEDIGELIGAALILSQKSENTPIVPQNRTDPKYLACSTKVNQRIATCGVSLAIGSCGMTGCSAEVRCDKGLAAYNCKGALQNEKYGEYFCDTKKRRNYDVSRRVVIDNVCAP